MMAGPGIEEEKLCFQCEKNPRIEGNPLCKHCAEEYPLCFQCGERERNQPFKLCLQCYHGARDGAAGIPRVPSLLEQSKESGAVSTSDDGTSTDEPDKVLHRLSKGQGTYKDVVAHFIKEWVKLTPKCPVAPKPLAVYAVCNPSIVKTFQKYGEHIRSSGTVSSNSDRFFHGTKLLCDLLSADEACSQPDCGICGVCRKGFDSSLIGTNISRFKRFGHGIYLAPNSSKCHDYTQGVEEYDIRAQLLCLVACGEKCELIHDNTELKQPPLNYHCVYGKSARGGSLNYDEIVVYDAQAVLPQYVVVYRHNGVDKIAK